MLNKYKQLLIGIIIGGLVFNFVPVFAQNNSTNIQVLFNNIKIKINGQIASPSIEPFIYKGQTFVPLRFVAEKLGKEVNFTNNTVEINDQTFSQNQSLSTKTPKGTRIIEDGKEIYIKETNLPEGAEIQVVKHVGFRYNNDLYVHRNFVDNILGLVINSDETTISFTSRYEGYYGKKATYSREFLALPENAIKFNSLYYNMKLFKDIIPEEAYNKAMNYSYD